MLQGIFEPVAERKRDTLDRIIRDFPERKFLLVGDSGEADLEGVYRAGVGQPGADSGCVYQGRSPRLSRRASLMLRLAATSAGGETVRVASESQVVDQPAQRPQLPPRATAPATTAPPATAPACALWASHGDADRLWRARTSEPCYVEQWSGVQRHPSKAASAAPCQARGTTEHPIRHGHRYPAEEPRLPGRTPTKPA